jgi:LacI family transcriptional regulator
LSQKSIAEELNISVATVSRSLHDHSNISRETRVKVAEAAARLGYRLHGGDANAAAHPGHRTPNRAFQRKRTRPGDSLLHIAAICRGTIHPECVHDIVAFRLIQGLSRAARSSRAILHLEYLAPDEFDRLDDPKHRPLTVNEGVAAGAVLVNHPKPTIIEALGKAIPLISFVRYPDCVNVDCVTEDNLGSVSKLFDHFISLGHKRIGLADSGYDAPSYQARFAGYVQNLVVRGMPFDPADAIIPGAPAGESERLNAMARHIADRRRRHHVTAWICVNDYVGYRLVAALQEIGLRVPEDISIAAFDNFLPPNGLPKLTTIDGPFETMSFVAMDQLIRRIEDRNCAPIWSMLNARLIVGSSTGTAPGSPARAEAALDASKSSVRSQTE